MSDLLGLLKTSTKNMFVGLAGPGTGKTFTFKQIIESADYKDKNILILSFIRKLIDDLTLEFEGYSNVEVLTLHAFASKFLSGVVQDLSDIDIEKKLDKIISEDYRIIEGNDKDFEELLHNNMLEEEDLKFYKNRTEFYKWKNQLYSFNSIILVLNKLFEKNEEIIPKYDLILVDEFQDFNELEWTLLKLLSKKSTIVIVGDDDQALYTDFRHASPNLIRRLYYAQNTENFSLDHCYRCTEVIVNTVNDLIQNVRDEGYLLERVQEKKFLYPEGMENKDLLSESYPKIEYIHNVPMSDRLFSKLSNSIKHDVQGMDSARILILVPSYKKEVLYHGLMKKGLIVTDFELFSSDEKNSHKNVDIIEAFDVLVKRKTDNLPLRKILHLYADKDELKELLVAGGNLWKVIGESTQEIIERDIEIYIKAKTGKTISDEELIRLSQIFNIKNLMKRMLTRFNPVLKDSIQIEMTTVMSSKGLTADFVYYIGIEGVVKEQTDKEICEFIVGITRATRKLTLISLTDDPKILNYINPNYIKRID